MKKIFAILALFLAFSFSANAQQKPDTNEAVLADVAELGKFITIAPASQKAVRDAFYFKNKSYTQENLSADQKQEIVSKTENMLEKALTPAQFAKFKANTALYDKLIK